MDGRLRVQKACDALNESKLLPTIVSVEGIEQAEGDVLNSIVNKFLDDVETIPESKEHLLPSTVKALYNDLVEENVSFINIASLKDSGILPVVASTVFIRTT